MDLLYGFLNELGYTHPLHPPLTHLTMGLVMGALIFRVAAVFPGFGKYAATARHCITLALAALVPTVILGVMDWFHFYGADLLFAFQMKILLASVLMLLLVLSVFLNIRLSPRSPAVLLVYVLGVFAAAGLGYFGGEIIYGQQTAEKISPASGSGKSLQAGYAEVNAVFRNNCTNCHAGNNPPADLNLNTYKSIMAGGKSGPVIIPENPGESELIMRVKGLASPRMPPTGPLLEDRQIEIIEKWIQAGAAGP